jgi:hypothetical protein
VVGDIAVLVLVIAFFWFVGTAVLQWLWNITVPDVTGWRKIGYWQAFRLSLLASMLTGGVSLFKLKFNL